MFQAPAGGEEGKAGGGRVGGVYGFGGVFERFVSLFQVRVLGCSQALGGAPQRSAARTSGRVTSEEPRFSLQPWAPCHLSLEYGP